MNQRGFSPIIAVLIIVLLIAGGIVYFTIFKSRPALAPSAPTVRAATLIQITTGEVINVTTGKKGELVELLKNPDFKSVGGVTLPFAPQNPEWADVPDGGYKTLFGQTYVIKASHILQIIDRNRNDITNQ